MKKFKLLFFTLFFSNFLISQPFVDINPGFRGVMQSAGSWIDFNKDKHLDVILAGDRYDESNHKILTKLYRNAKKNKFWVLKTSIPDVYRGSIDCGDYDNDGDQDIAIIGETYNNKFISKIYRNNGNNVFVDIKANLIPVRDGSVEWGDYDNDGDLDILLTGESYKGSIISKIYRNDGKNLFTDINAGLVPVFLSSAKWGDYDNDDDLDVLITGERYNGSLISKIYRNQGKDIFKDIHAGLEGVRNSSVDWGDLNNDGNPDILLTGEASGKRIISKVYKNNGNGSFSSIFTDIVGVRSGCVDLGDYDNDGDPDVLLTGETYRKAISKVYRNDSNFVFTDIYAELPGIYFSYASWGDYDRDSDLDVLLSGLDNCYGFISSIFRNDGKIRKKPIAETESSIWATTPLSFEKSPSYYYFVYSSCYCNPDGQGKKGFNAYVSNIHYTKTLHDLQKKFNHIIINNVKEWPEITTGHRVSIGFDYKKDAEEARRKVIREYQDESFTVHYVNW